MGLRRGGPYRDTEKALVAHKALARATEKLDRMQANQFNRFDLTANEFRVLEALKELGPLTQAELSDRMAWQHSTTHAVIKRMAEDGLVERSAHDKDKRAAKMNLTAEGRRLLARVMPAHATMVRAQMSVLEARQLDTLLRLCEKLVNGDPLRFIQELMSIEVLEDEEEP